MASGQKPLGNFVNTNFLVHTLINVEQFPSVTVLGTCAILVENGEWARFSIDRFDLIHIE